MKKFLLIIFIFLGVSPFAKSQNRKLLDSLKVVYQKTTQDTTRLLVMVQIASQYYASKPDTCISICQKVLAESQKKNYLKGQQRSLSRIGVGYYVKGNYEQALLYYKKELDIIEKMGDKVGKANNYNNMGLVYYVQGNYKQALEVHQKSLEICKTINYEQGVARSYNSIGIIYKEYGNTDVALENYLKSLKIQEKLNNKNEVATIFTNIGFMYLNKEDNDKALGYFDKALLIQQELNEKMGIANSYNAIGSVYSAQKKYKQALETFDKGIILAREIKDKRREMGLLTDMGILKAEEKKYEQALLDLEQALKIAKEIKSKKGQISALQNIANVYVLKKEYEKSLQFAEEAYSLLPANEMMAQKKSISEKIYQIHKELKNYPKALAFLEIFKQTNDTLNTVEKAKKIANLEAKAELETKQKEITLLNKDNLLLEKDNQLQKTETEREKNAKLAIAKQAEADNFFALARQEKDKRRQDSLLLIAQKNQLETEKLRSKEQQMQAKSKMNELGTQKAQEEKKSQQVITLLIAFFLLGALVLIYFLWKTRQKIQQANGRLKQANKEITKKKVESVQALQLVEVQKQEIEEKNQDITASITYALRIQNAIIPRERALQQHLNCFVLFEPKDIVSGDFYWFAQKDNCKILAVGDCTGHGVPGAFLTMIANNILNQVIHDLEIHEPDQILNLMQSFLEKTISQANGIVGDGMDISIIKIEKNQISYAGAMNPLYYVENQEFKIINADKKSISGSLSEDFSYQKHIIKINEEPFSKQNAIMFYLLSDGFQDQFGGESNRKFMTKNLKKLLFEISQEPLEKQKQVLKTTLEAWKENNNQTDDITLVGFSL